MLSKHTLGSMDGLRKIAAYKAVFALPVNDDVFEKKIESFFNDFCSYNFSDTNYATLISENKNFVSLEIFVQNANLEVLLQYFTFFLWTNNSFPGYFKKKILDGTIYILLCRLNEILDEK